MNLKGILLPAFMLLCTRGTCQSTGYVISTKEAHPALNAPLHLTVSNHTAVKIKYLIDLEGKFNGRWQGCMTDIFNISWEHFVTYLILNKNALGTLTWHPLRQKANYIPEKGRPYRFYIWTSDKTHSEIRLAVSSPVVFH